MPFSYRGETRELDDLTRSQAGGSFLRLRDGYTHYELSNPASEKTVVLVHGFSIPYYIFDPTFTFLSQEGFRVLRYDLFGRGVSDRPNTRYHIDLFVRQLGDLLDGLGMSQPVTLVGLSTGGPISATFTVRFPDRVKSLALIGPVGGKPLPFIRALRLATAPLIGETLFNMVHSDEAHPSRVSGFFHREVAGRFRARYAEQMQYRGFRRAILSTIRSGMLDPIPGVYRQLGKMDKSVLLFWGRQDETVPFHHSEVLQAAIPQLEFHPVDDCGHIPHYEKPDEVNPVLLQFLRAGAPSGQRVNR